MMGEVLSRHRDIAYWMEPNYIWKYRSPQSTSDLRTAEEATPQVARYVRARFARYMQQRGKSRFMEKTPSNCFRLPFMLEVFPDALFLNVIRDGRDATFSAVKKWAAPAILGPMRRRITSGEIPLRDLPYYVRRWVRDFGRRLFPVNAYVWGPRFPGIEELAAAEGPLVACAAQWRESVEAVTRGLEGVPAEQQHTVRFEQFIADPRSALLEISSFLGLPPDAEMLDFAGSFVRPDFVGRWRNKGSEDVRTVLTHAGEAMSKLGYEL